MGVPSPRSIEPGVTPHPLVVKWIRITGFRMAHNLIPKKKCKIISFPSPTEPYA